MKNVKKAYMTPMVEVMNARVEKGFAGSCDGTGRISMTMPTPLTDLSNPDFD